MSDPTSLNQLLAAEVGDVGCDEAFEVLDMYVEAELAGEDVSLRYPGVALHLRSCPACREDYAGLRAAAGEE
jgi:predicted anti-sigma-YlaC factor YlaD